MDFFKSLPKHTQVIIGAVAVIVLVLSLVFVKNQRASAQDEEWTSSDVETEEVQETSEDDVENIDDESAEDNVLMADVKGAVVNPGVYEFEEGDRVETLIEMAGGLTAEADPNQVNMAQVVEDEMVIYVPTKGEVVSQAPPSEATSTSSSSENEGKVNINTATLEELMTLPGIGESKAQAIIDTREDKGGYKEIEEIKDAPGIGDSIYEQIKDLIYV